MFSFISVHAQDLDEKYGIDLLKPGTVAPEIIINKDGAKMNLLERTKASISYLTSGLLGVATAARN